MLAVLHHKKCQGGCKITIGPEDISERGWKYICNIASLKRAPNANQTMNGEEKL